MPYVLPREAATVHTATHGEFHLDILSVRAAQALVALDANLPGREYCVQALHVVVETPPELSIEALRELPDGVLRQLARAFAASPHGLNKPLPPKQPVFAAFKDAVRSYLAEQERRLRETFESIRSSLNGIMVPLAQQLTSTLLPSVTADLARSVRVNHDLLSALRVVPPTPLILPDIKPILPATALTALSQSITSMVDTIGRIPVSPLAGLARDLAALQKGTYWAQQSRDYLADIVRVAARGSVAAQLAPLFSAASDMSLSFGAYFDDVRQELVIRPAVRRSLERDVVIPAQTSAIALRTVAVIGDRAAGGGIVAPAPAAPMAAHLLRSNIDGYLARVAPRLVGQWHGAWEALESTNPDRLRQAAHSGRELLNQILAELAPDSAFSPDELKQRKDKKPTRKMRVAKMLSTTTDSSRVALVDAQAQLADEMYGILSGVAHSRKTVDEGEVGAYLMSLDGVLLFLLSRVLGHE